MTSMEENKSFFDWIRYLKNKPSQPIKQVPNKPKAPAFKCASCYSTRKSQSGWDSTICEECWYTRMAGCF